MEYFQTRVHSAAPGRGWSCKVLEELFGFVSNVLKLKANGGNGNPEALLKARLSFCVQRICGW